MESGKHGLRPLSIVLAMPYALTIFSAISFNYALLCLGLQLAVHGVEVTVALLIVALAAAPVVGTLCYFNHLLEALARYLRIIQHALRILVGPRKQRE